jgi:hypothetical protein
MGKEDVVSISAHFREIGMLKIGSKISNALGNPKLRYTSSHSFCIENYFKNQCEIIVYSPLIYLTYEKNHVILRVDGLERNAQRMMNCLTKAIGLPHECDPKQVLYPAVG